MRVVVAEDSMLVREGIAKLLEVQGDIEIVALCEDLDGLLAAVEAERPDVVLTDIRMPPTGTDEGIKAAAALRVSHPDVGVVVLSQYAEPSYALSLLEDGSEGRAYLLKERVSDVAGRRVDTSDSTTFESITEPPAATSRIAARSSSTSLTRSLSR